MKMMKNYILFAFLMVVNLSWAQNKKIWVSGASRAVMYGDDYSTDAENDSTTVRKTQGGHALVDLGVNIQPSKNILIQGKVRIRNDYGGFWGSGVTFDVRQLYIKGIIGGFLKYQLGDINYKLTKYTFSNNVGLINKYDGVITGVPLEQVQYDLFYSDDDTWRQQGAAIDFALEFDKVLKEAQFNLFTTRVRATNFSTEDDRLYSGGSVTFVQSKKLKFGGQFANLYDFSGTSNNTVYLRNPVYTGVAEVNHKIKNTQLRAALETGMSKLEWEGSTDAPVLEDYFYDMNVKAIWDKKGVAVSAAYRNVGPNFRSAGAQTMQLNYLSAPAAYQRYGNEQNVRAISMLDVYRDASLYRTQITPGLMAYDPRYDNATPYGRATPNRKGFDVLVEYEDVKKRWKVEGDAELLSDVVGEGTAALRNYTTASGMAEIRINKLLNWKERKFWISGRFGMQDTKRTGEQTYEEVNLATRFQDFNLTATIHKDLDFIAQYRIWNTNGNESVAERNEYSTIVDFTDYSINYSESILGAGLQYAFSKKTNLRFMWQTFTWNDVDQITLPYNMNTWNLFFTMKF